jgi:hypothetical protein
MALEASYQDLVRRTRHQVLVSLIFLAGAPVWIAAGLWFQGWISVVVGLLWIASGLFGLWIGISMRRQLRELEAIRLEIELLMRITGPDELYDRLDLPPHGVDVGLGDRLQQTRED